MEGDLFVGRERVLALLKDALLHQGVTVLEGTKRSGKTSLIRKVLVDLTAEKNIDWFRAVDFQSFAGEQGWDSVKKGLDEERSFVEREGKGALVFSEISALVSCGDDCVDGFLDYLGGLKKEGIFVLLEATEDIKSTSVDSIFSPAQKQRLLELVGDAVVVNELMSEEEIRGIVSGGSPPLFTQETIDYLVAQAGGHPMFANILAQGMFDLLKRQQQETPTDTSDAEFMDRFREAIKQNMAILIVGVFDVIRGGFDPLTWQYTGPEPKPDEQVYRNMLPRESSTIFREWLAQELQKDDVKEFIQTTRDKQQKPFS